MSTSRDTYGPDDESNSEMAKEYTGSFIITAKHKGDFIGASETRAVRMIEQRFKKAVDHVDGKEVEHVFNKIHPVHHCVVSQSGNRGLNENVRKETAKTFKEREEAGLPVLNSDGTVKAFKKAIRDELETWNLKKGKSVDSLFIISSYDANVPQLWVIETIKEYKKKPVIKDYKIPGNWAMGGEVSLEIYTKISQYLDDNLHEGASVERVAHIVSMCTREAATHGEVDTKIGDDNSVGGDLIVFVVQDVKKELPAGIAHLWTRTQILEGNQNKKISFYNFGKIIESGFSFAGQGLEAKLSKVVFLRETFTPVY